MNTLKITKWFGFALLCLGILSIPLALAGLRAARDFQDRTSQMNPVLENGEQIDLLPGREVVQTAPNTGKDSDEYFLTGTGRTDHKMRRPRHGEYYLTGGIAAMDPCGTRFCSLAGGMSALDPNFGHDGLHQAGGIQAMDPHHSQLTPAGGIQAMDPHHSRLTPAGGIAALDPHHSRLTPAGGAKALDPSGGRP